MLPVRGEPVSPDLCTTPGGSRRLWREFGEARARALRRTPLVPRFDRSAAGGVPGSPTPRGVTCAGSIRVVWAEAAPRWAGLALRVENPGPSEIEPRSPIPEPFYPVDFLMKALDRPLAPRQGGRRRHCRWVAAQTGRQPRKGREATRFRAPSPGLPRRGPPLLDQNPNPLRPGERRPDRGVLQGRRQVVDGGPRPVGGTLKARPGARGRGDRRCPTGYALARPGMATHQPPMPGPVTACAVLGLHRRPQSAPVVFARWPERLEAIRPPREGPRRRGHGAGGGGHTGGRSRDPD
jgi:hypothetical protein